MNVIWFIRNYAVHAAVHCSSALGLYILPLQMARLYNIAVALSLERLYNKTSGFGIDYEKGYYSPILINVHCTMQVNTLLKC